MTVVVRVRLAVTALRAGALEATSPGMVMPFDRLVLEVLGLSRPWAPSRPA
jgi:hypothetical protein